MTHSLLSDEIAPSNQAVIAIPPHPRYLLAALDFCESLAQGLGFDGQEQMKIRLAVEETFNFFCDLTASPDSSQPVSLVFTPRADGLLICMTVKSLPVDVDHLPSFSPELSGDDTDFNALSLFLAQKSMDSIEIANHGRDGIRVELLKRCATAHVSSLIQATEPEVANDPPPEQFDDTIRPARDEEALEISRCAYLTYGHTYEDYIYYPERIREMNRNKELYSLVAVTAKNDVMGHCALKFMPGRTDSAEMGVLFVNPTYRKHHLASRLTVALLEQAEKLGLKSVFTRAVTGHPASQRITGKMGFSDCCLYLALFPSNVDLKQLGGTLATKMSGMLQWKALVPPRQRSVDLPPSYRDIITTLYQQTGLAFISPPDPAQNNVPKLRVQKIPVLNVGLLDVESNGSQPQMVADWIAGQCRRLCSEKLDVIYLNINLEEQGAALIVEQASHMGFVFSGIAPDAFVDHDAVVLQYLNLPGDPFAGMVVNSQNGERLRDVIQQEWQHKASATQV